MSTSPRTDSFENKKKKKKKTKIGSWIDEEILSNRNFIRKIHRYIGNEFEEMDSETRGRISIIDDGQINPMTIVLAISRIPRYSFRSSAFYSRNHCNSLVTDRPISKPLCCASPYFCSWPDSFIFAFLNGVNRNTETTSPKFHCLRLSSFEFRSIVRGSNRSSSHFEFKMLKKRPIVKYTVH